MKRKLYKRAQHLAARGYTAIVSRECAGRGYVYTLSFAEFPAGYRLHYDTLGELREDEQAALIDFIYFLLLDGEPVPGAI